MADNNSFDANKAIEDIKKDRNLMMLVVGAVMLIVGVFLPWAEADAGFISVSANGLDANGTLPLILAVVAVGAGLNVFKKDTKTMWLAALIASAVAALMVLLDWPSDEGLGVITVGFGYYLSLAGSIAMLVGSSMKYKSQTVKPSDSSK